MVSFIQHLANKQNSLKSTGPGDTSKTRLNSQKFGFTAQAVLIKGESEEDYETLAEGVRDELDPETVMQSEMTGQIIHCLWRLRRVPIAEQWVGDTVSGLSNGVYIKWTEIFQSPSFDNILRHEIKIRKQLFNLMTAYSMLRGETQ